MKNTYGALCKSIGRAATAWAGAEQTLDLCVTTVFRYGGGDTLRKDLPRSLSVKTKFMRDAFKRISKLRAFSQSGVRIMDQMDRLADVRNDMVHAALACDHPIGGEWFFLKFDYGSDIHAVRSVSFSLSALNELERKTLETAARLTSLQKRLMRLARRSR